MDISIMFNWPPGQNSARVSFGIVTADDMDHQFRVGIIKKDEQDKIYWLKPGWTDADSLHLIKFDAFNGEKVVVEKRKKGDEKKLTSHIWDIEEKWPANAVGGKIVIVPWSFH